MKPEVHHNVTQASITDQGEVLPNLSVETEEVTGLESVYGEKHLSGSISLSGTGDSPGMWSSRVTYRNAFHLHTAQSHQRTTRGQSYPGYPATHTQSIAHRRAEDSVCTGYTVHTPSQD